MTRTQLHCEGSSVLDRIQQVTERRARTQAKQLNFLLTYQSLVQHARPALNIGDFTRIAQDQNRDPWTTGSVVNTRYQCMQVCSMSFSFNLKCKFSTRIDGI